MPNFEITLTSTNQAAIAPARQYLDLLKQINAEAAKVDKTWAQTATRTAASHRRSGQSAAQEAKKAADQIAKEAKKAADAKIKEDQRAARNAERAAAGEERARAQAEGRKQREIAATAARQDREASKAASNAERWVAREYRDRVRFEQQKQREQQKSAAAAEKASRREAEMQDRAAEKTGLFGRALQTVSGYFAGFIGFQAIVNEIANAFDVAQQSAMEAGKFVNDYRESLLELAALKGRLGETGPEVQESLQFRARTLQTREAATAFQLSALGAGEAGIDRGGVEKSISEDEFKKLMVFVGSMQAAEGGSADTYGALAGQVPMMMGHHTTAEESFRKVAQFYKILQPGGSTFASGTEQFLKNAPYAQLFEDPAQMLALQSAFSIKNRGGAGEQVEQFMRATVGGLGRMRGVQVEGDSQKIGEYLGSIGATDQMTPIDIGKRVAADFARQREASTAQGQQFNAMSYLLHKGYGNQEDRMALMAFADLMASGTYEKTFEPLTKTMPTTAEAMNPIKRFQGSDLAAQQRKGELAGELAKTSVGMGPQEYYEALTRQAHARLKASGRLTGTYEETMSPGLFGGMLAPLTGQVTDTEVRKEAFSMLSGEAKRVGVDMGGGQFGGISGTPGQMAESFYSLGGKIGQAGGNIMPGMDQLLAKMDMVANSTNALTKQIADAQQKADAGVGPGGANVAPPVVQPPKQPPGWRDRP